MNDPSWSRKRLYDIAMTQQGYFTTAQAHTAGYDSALCVYHVKRGDWHREARGVYRLTDYPPTDRPDLVLWSLWSSDLSGQPRGIYSHDTALSIYDLSDANPSKLHMTVPPTFRRRGLIPRTLVLHRALLSESDVEQMEGYGVTRPLRTLRDLADSGSLSTGLLLEAAVQAIHRGLVESTDLMATPEWAARRSLVSQLKRALKH
jgi:predicted transcriptional regulator of viral defense system